MEAVENNNLEEVRLLIEKGADVTQGGVMAGQP